MDADSRDAAAAERVLAGDIDAFEAIVRRWQGPLVNLAYRYCRDRAAAEELAQEAFLKAFRSLGRWRGEGAFSTWLFAVALSVCRSWARRRRIREVPLDTLGPPGLPPEAQELLETREREALVRRAVRSLPPRYRDAVLLFYFFELDLRRTAAALALPEGTVKSHLHRGRKLLERRLGGLLAPRRGDNEEKAWTSSTGSSSPSRS